MEKESDGEVSGRLGEAKGSDGTGRWIRGVMGGEVEKESDGKVSERLGEAKGSDGTGRWRRGVMHGEVSGRLGEGE